jgi:hypothetical protein
MPNDPHRDALAAALARVDALEEENRELRDRSGGQPLPPAQVSAEQVATLVSPLPASEGPDSIDFDAVQAMARETLADPSPPKSPGRRVKPPKLPKKAKAARAKCDGCGSPRTSAVVFAGATMVSARPGVRDRMVQKFRHDARACADCGQVTLQLLEEDRDWLRENERAVLE